MLGADDRKQTSPPTELQIPMVDYPLYLESGPKRRKTMVHVLHPDLLGCVATGPTTDAALAAVPGAIHAYRRFLLRHGEMMDPGAPFTIHIAEHVMEGDWLGEGSPYIMFGPDHGVATDADIAPTLRRSRALRADLAAWAAAQSDADLDAPPPSGSRSARAILLHVLGATGPNLSGALGKAPGFSATHGAATRGEIPLPVALRRSSDLIADRLAAATPEERAAVRHLPGGPRTLRKALRQLLEHDWNHLAELSRFPDGPTL